VLYNLPYIHEWSNDVIEVGEVVVVNGLEGVYGTSVGIKQHHVVAYYKRVSFCYKYPLLSGSVGSSVTLADVRLIYVRWNPVCRL
jgi:hypothetical protein